MRRFRAFVGLGSNVGNRDLMVRRAAAEMHSLPLTRLVRLSPLYETDPIGRRNQPRFVNAAAELSTPLDPVELLQCLKAIEARLGRRMRERWGPREIDLDILLYEGLVYRDDRVSVPHTDLARRAFALVPLRDIAPGVVVPGAQQSIASIAAGLCPAGIRLRTAPSSK